MAHMRLRSGDCALAGMRRAGHPEQLAQMIGRFGVEHRARGHRAPPLATQLLRLVGSAAVAYLRLVPARSEEHARARSDATAQAGHLRSVIFIFTFHDTLKRSKFPRYTLRNLMPRDSGLALPTLAASPSLTCAPGAGSRNARRFGLR
jgi:hypothetical protein